MKWPQEAGPEMGIRPRRCPFSRENGQRRDRKSTRLNSSHANISYAVFCLKKKKKNTNLGQLMKARSILCVTKDSALTVERVRSCTSLSLSLADKSWERNLTTYTTHAIDV